MVGFLSWKNVCSTIKYCWKYPSQGGYLPNYIRKFTSKKGGVYMDTYEILTLLFIVGSFLIALLTYIYRNGKRK